jgi:adenylate kinase
MGAPPRVQSGNGSSPDLPRQRPVTAPPCNLLVLGPPGAGKGTLAELLRARLGILHVSTGDMFRAAISAGTELGKRVAATINRGSLVSDELTVGLIRERLAADDMQRGYLLDGFPRTEGQAAALDRAMEASGGIDKAIYIRVSQEELIGRLSNRLLCADCQAPHSAHGPDAANACTRCGGRLYQREDDKPEAVRKRIEVYIEETAPLIDHYRDLGILQEVEGEGSVEEVQRGLAALVDSARIES